MYIAPKRLVNRADAQSGAPVAVVDGRAQGAGCQAALRHAIVAAGRQGQLAAQVRQQLVAILAAGPPNSLPGPVCFHQVERMVERLSLALFRGWLSQFFLSAPRVQQALEARCAGSLVLSRAVRSLYVPFVDERRRVHACMYSRRRLGECNCTYFWPCGKFLPGMEVGPPCPEATHTAQRPFPLCWRALSHFQCG